MLTQAAEAQAGTGHDALHFTQWEIHHHADKLVPVDDVVQRLTAKNGKVDRLAEYLARPEGHWRAVPSSWGAQAKPPCARVSVLKSAAGIDVTKMYPVKAEYIPEMDEWTWETHLKAAEACHKAGMTFGIGLGTTAIPPTPRARCSPPTAPIWSMPRATSPSIPTVMRGAGVCASW